MATYLLRTRNHRGSRTIAAMLWRSLYCMHAAKQVNTKHFNAVVIPREPREPSLFVRASNSAKDSFSFGQRWRLACRAPLASPQRPASCHKPRPIARRCDSYNATGTNSQASAYGRFSEKPECDDNVARQQEGPSWVLAATGAVGARGGSYSLSLRPFPIGL